jgi:hypothetical protein
MTEDDPTCSPAIDILRLLGHAAYSCNAVKSVAIFTRFIRPTSSSARPADVIRQAVAAEPPQNWR